MEKYFIVTEKSELHSDYFNYRANRLAVNALIKSFFTENGIEAKEYYASDDRLMIVPAEADGEKFGSYLGANQGNGLRTFKANSKINKAWIRVLKDAGMKVIRKPMVMLYFQGLGGKSRSRLFDINGVVYCSYESEKVNIPDGFIEIKASEFFKVIEDDEDRKEAN